MVHDRLQQLLDYHLKEPHDPFIVYGIALEYLKSDKKVSASYFDKLLQEHPDYLPTYYHAALLFQDLEQIEKSANLFKKGIALATKKNDQHALRELSNAFQNFLFEEDMDEDE